MTTTLPTPPTAALQAERHLTRRRATVWGTAAFALFLALFFSVVRTPDTPWFVALDRWWHDVVVALRSPGLNAFEIAVDIATGGPIGGTVLLIVPVVVLLILRRWWSVLYYAIGALLAGTLSQVAKRLVARERPTDPLWHVDFGSFPSGHLTGFTFFVLAVCILAARRWVTIVGGIVLAHEVFNRTYLAAHWLSDTVAGLALGTSVALLLWAALRPLILRQQQRRLAARTR